jgi:hypothetical protein
MDCPCDCRQWAWPGSFVLAFGLYWVWALGLPYMITHVRNADLDPDADLGALVVTALVLAGLFCLLVGIHKARSHDNEFEGGNVAVLLIVGGVSVWAIWHGWFWTDDGWFCFHLSRAFWVGLLGASIFAVWLEFRGQFRSESVSEPVPTPRRSIRRIRTIQVVEEIEGHGVENLPPVIGPYGETHPQIVYEQDRNGNLIPMPQLPSPDRVPVRRR